MVMTAKMMNGDIDDDNEVRADNDGKNFDDGDIDSFDGDL